MSENTPGPVVEVVIEVPRFGLAKRDHRGRIDFISPLPCPFNYGSLPGTRAADGAPIDALVLGRRLRAGTVVRVPVVAVAQFVDAGDDDPKLVCSWAPLGHLERAQVDGFFHLYARLKRLLSRARGRVGETAYHGLTEAGLVV